MDIVDENDILIEGSIATWDMGLRQGNVLGSYSGTFKFRCFLTPTQQLAAAREYRELLGPQLLLANEHEGQLSFALSQLKHRIISAPPFWTAPTQNGEMPGNIPDLNIILLVLDAAISAEKKFRDKTAADRNKLLDGAIRAAEAIQEEATHE